jgi:microsomal epoxide hydrolase
MKSDFLKTSDGVQLHYLEAGTGQAILFIPGATAPAEIWQRQIDCFGKHYRVVSLDPRSHGKSEKPTEGHYPERMARDIEDAIDALKLRPVILVPWGFACSQVLQYGQHHGTGKLRAVVLVDGYVGREPTFDHVMGYLRWCLQLQEDRPNHQRQFVRSWFDQPQSDDYLEELTRATMKMPTSSFVAMVAAWLTLPNPAPLLSKIDVPFMYIFTYQKRAQADVVRKYAPAARVEFIDKAGHAVFVDQPETFNTLLTDFNKKLSGRAP